MARRLTAPASASSRTPSSAPSRWQDAVSCAIRASCSAAASYTGAHAEQSHDIASQAHFIFQQALER